MTEMLTVQGVSKQYGPLEVLRDVSLTVARGEVVCVVGPSGGGKSTLMRCINHLEVVDRGTITLDGDLVGYQQRGRALHQVKQSVVCRQRQDIGMVFQHFNLFSHLNALDNVTLGPRTVLGLSKPEAHTQAYELLGQVGLSDHAKAYPRQLSGGQQQRVAIARALAMRPKVLLFDEPTSALDPQLVGEVLRVIRALADTGITMVIVTHEIRFALEVADRLVLMQGGRIAYDAPPSEWRTSPHPDAVTFMKHVTSPEQPRPAAPVLASMEV
jgi:ABC-type polar amino acid transport system ATPase subunit